jgi:hypothetical protein
MVVQVDELMNASKRAPGSLKLSQFGLDDHLSLWIRHRNGVPDLLRYRITPNVLQFFPSFV